MSYFSPLVAALVTLGSIAVILSGRFGNKLQDIPNQRSLHVVPVPRVGGIGLIAGVSSGWALMFTALTWWLVLPLIGLFAVSLLDDMHGLPVRQRLPAHLVAAVILVVGSGLYARQGIAVALIVLLLTVWMTNLYNFMDGADGLAGGMALFGFAFYGLAALMAHDATLAMLNLTISAAALGFLFHNFPPAKVFMGDAGSIPLGFLVAAMGLWGWQRDCWEMWFPPLVFSPFIVDATVTLVKRTLRGARVTEAHREHYYQRAIRMGQGHRHVASIEYALMLAAGISALAAVRHDWPWQMLAIWVVIYFLLMRIQDVRWKRRGL